MLRLAPWLIALIAVAVCGALLVRNDKEQQVIASLKTKVAAQDHELEAMKGLNAGHEVKRVKPEDERQRSVEAIKAAPVILTVGDPAMRNDPIYGALWHRHQLRNINRQYGEAFAKLNLRPDKLAKLKDLMIDRIAADWDARDAAEKAGLTGADAFQAVRQAENEVNSEMAALVGYDVAPQIAQAGQISGMVATIQNEVGADFAGAGVPLSSDQLSALAQICANFEFPERLAKNPDLAKIAGAPVDTVTDLTPLNQAMLDQAAQVLSPAQLPILRQSLIDRNEDQDFLRRALAAGQENK